MASGHRQAVPKPIQQDWANREYVEVISGSIKKITDFLNSFDMSCRSRVAVLNEKLTVLERKIEYLESWFSPRMDSSVQEKVDILQRVIGLTAQLQDVLNNTTKTAAKAIHVGHFIDSGSIKAVDSQNSPRFDKCIEEFFAVCDQIENHLKTVVESHQQGSCSVRYLAVPVVPTRLESGPIPETNAISYPQFLNVTRSHVKYLKEIHDLLLSASQNIGPWE